MTSLLILAGTLPLSFIIYALCIAVAARLAKSPHSSLRRILLTTFYFLLGNIVLVLLGFVTIGLIAPPPIVRVLILLNLLAIQWILNFLILKYSLRLSWLRTLIPIGGSVVAGIVQFILAIAVMKPFMVEAFVVSGSSMEPTVMKADRLFVCKCITPQRWDLVAYHIPGPRHDIYVKRVIALPGEQLTFHLGNIYIDGKPVPMPKVLVDVCHAYPSAAPANLATYHDDQPIAVGADDFFLLGDKTDRSVDSRMQGPAPRASIVGVADVRYLPLNRFTVLR